MNDSDLQIQREIWHRAVAAVEEAADRRHVALERHDLELANARARAEREKVKLDEMIGRRQADIAAYAEPPKDAFAPDARAAIIAGGAVLELGAASVEEGASSGPLGGDVAA